MKTKLLAQHDQIQAKMRELDGMIAHLVYTGKDAVFLSKLQARHASLNNERITIAHKIKVA